MMRLRWIIHRRMGGGFPYAEYREWVEYDSDSIAREAEKEAQNG